MVPHLLLEVFQLLCGEGCGTSGSHLQGLHTACGLCDLHMRSAAVQGVQRPLKDTFTSTCLSIHPHGFELQCERLVHACTSCSSF